jgi:hypothetical protein
MRANLSGISPSIQASLVRVMLPVTTMSLLEANVTFWL